MYLINSFYDARKELKELDFVYPRENTCIVIMGIPLCRKHVGDILTLLAAQELYDTFREETPVEDEGLFSNFEFIDRGFLYLSHCREESESLLAKNSQTPVLQTFSLPTVEFIELKFYFSGEI